MSDNLIWWVLGAACVLYGLGNIALAILSAREAERRLALVLELKRLAEKGGGDE